MPYEYKRPQKCKQKSGDRGTYVSKKVGTKHQKCWKSEEAFNNAQEAGHAQGLDEADFDDLKWPKKGHFEFPDLEPGPKDPTKIIIPFHATKKTKKSDWVRETLLRHYIKNLILNEYNL